MNPLPPTPNSPTTNSPTTNLAGASLLEWPAPEPMGAELRRRREEMLVGLRGQVRARRRRRTTGRALMAAAVLLAAAGAWRGLTRPVPSGPAPIAKTGPAPDAPSPRTPGPTAPAAKPLIAIIPTDPTVVSRLAAPGGTSRITVVDDQGVLPLLERVGSPGLIRVDGRVILSRDLTGSAEAAPEAAPQGRAPAAGATHG